MSKFTRSSLIEFYQTESHLSTCCPEIWNSREGNTPVFVGVDGSISNITIIRSLDPGCDKEVIRIIKTLPKFIPANQNGENVAVWYTLPIAFKLGKSYDKCFLATLNKSCTCCVIS